MIDEFLVNKLISTALNLSGIVYIVLYSALFLMMLKIADTTYDLVLKIRKKEKIIREIEVIEKRKVEPVIAAKNPNSMIEKAVSSGKVKLVCSECGSDVRILVDGTILCPNCKEVD